LETSKLQAYNSRFLCSGGVAELVEKVVMSNMGDSTISHKVEVLPEAGAEGPQKEKKKKGRVVSTPSFLM
jgi:hypothetical protein